MFFRTRKNISEQIPRFSILSATPSLGKCTKTDTLAYPLPSPSFSYGQLMDKQKKAFFSFECSLLWGKKLCFFTCEKSGRRGGLLQTGRAYLNISGQWMKNATERVFQQTTPAHFGQKDTFRWWLFTEGRITSLALRSFIWQACLI